MKRCVIAAAGETYGRSIVVREGDFVIAADAGYRYLSSQNIRPDVIVGDFDSAEKPDFPDLVVLPHVKDDTDTLAAIRLGFGRGCTEFDIYGGLGGRLGHTMANLQCLAMIARRGGTGRLWGDGCIAAATCSELHFDASMKGYISLFSHTDRCSGVCVRGLLYELEDAVLDNTFPLGVSNEFIGREATVKIDSGILLAVYEDREKNGG